MDKDLERETQRERERQTETVTERDRQRERETDRQTETERERQRDKENTTRIVPFLYSVFILLNEQNILNLYLLPLVVLPLAEVELFKMVKCL